MHWLLAFAGVAAAIRNDAILGYVPPPPPNEAITLNVDGISRRAPAAASPIQARTFQQLIDHADPSKGTFSQRYWYNAEFYRGPGSPIVLNAPGEYAADDFTGYTTNRTLPGVFAQTSGGAAIILEHRYWGQSSPFDTLTADTLQYLTLDQAIQDVVHFAKEVHLDFDPGRASTPDKAPWVLSGCSYPGALSAWIHDLAPGTFWAYHCSSAPVETVTDFWEYYTPVEEAMPRNCSADYRRVMRYVDRVLANGTAERAQKLKTAFGFGDLRHNDDFASAITSGLGQWQGQQFYSGYSGFYQMCDYIEVSKARKSPPFSVLV